MCPIVIGTFNAFGSGVLVTDEVDAGAVVLAACLKLRGRAITIDELKRLAGGPPTLSPSDMVVAAGKAGFKAKIRKTTLERLSQLPMPLIAMTKEGGFLLVAQVVGGKVVVRDPLAPDVTELSIEDFRQRWSEHTIMVTTSRWEEATSQFGLAWFLPRLLKHRLLLGEVLAAALFLQMFALVTPLFTMVIIDKVLSVGRAQTLDVLIVGLMIITLFEFIIGTMRRTLSHHMTKRVDAELVAGLFHHMTHLPMAFFATRQTGDTVARVRELEGIRAFLTGPALTAVVDLPFAIVFFVCMGLFSPLLTGVAIVAFLLVLGLHGLAAPALRERLQKKMKSASDSQSFLVEVVTGMETLKALAIEPQMQRAWEEQVVTQSEISGRTEQLTNTVSQIAGLVQKITVAATLWIGANMVIQGALTPGQLIAFNMLVGRALAPAMRIAQLFQQIHQTRVSVKRLAEILNAKTEPKASSGNLPSLQGKVTFDHVSFRYANDGPAAVEDITLEVSPGEVIGIVGSSGSGKTTLMKLLQRLYIPQSGRILVDGINIAQVDPTWLRRHMGVVLQDAMLFNRSIRDNIAIRNPGASFATVEAVARLAGADDFIRALPHAYDSIVGERGCLLSAGQRQRIAIAQALLTNPSILIMDEATSALDYESEQTIQHNMREICAGRTVFIIAHRLSTVRGADRIIAIENGHLVEEGPPALLRSQGGRYARLLQLEGVSA